MLVQTIFSTPQHFALSKRLIVPCTLLCKNLTRIARPKPIVARNVKDVEGTIFLCEDDTKAALVEAGADPWSIYTREELQILIEHHRAKPFIPDELLRLHQAKRTLNLRITK